MASHRVDLGNVAVLLRKTRKVVPYPWELLTHGGRVQHDARWKRKLAGEVRQSALQRSILIPPGWTDSEVAQMWVLFCKPASSRDPTGQFWMAGFEPSGVVLDIGASFGDWAVLVAAMPSVRKVISFEPGPCADRAMELILANKQNRADVDFRKSAVWSTTGTTRFGDVGSSALGVFGGGQTVVPSIAIDDMCLSEVGFIKINVEGAEMEVLEGADRTLRELHPKIAVQAHSRKLREAVDIRLRSLGYSLYAEGTPFRAMYPMDFVQNLFYRHD